MMWDATLRVFLAIFGLSVAAGACFGDMTKDEAMALQTFTGRLCCDEAEQYEAKDAPTCVPICEACMLRWIEADLPFNEAQP